MDCIILPPSSFNCLYQSSTVCPNLSTCTMLITQLVDLMFKCGRLKRQTTCPCAIQDKMNWINSWGPPLQACLALPRGNEVSATLHSWWGPEHPWRCRSPLRECSSPKRTAANWYTAAPWPPVQTRVTLNQLWTSSENQKLTVPSSLHSSVQNVNSCLWVTVLVGYVPTELYVTSRSANRSYKL